MRHRPILLVEEVESSGANCLENEAADQPRGGAITKEGGEDGRRDVRCVWSSLHELAFTQFELEQCSSLVDLGIASAQWRYGLGSAAHFLSPGQRYSQS